ncbi:MAG: hypothetical protein JWM87_789 [Candidatus Eremiobacteraeota bacterium]|nr:hypothetical protein [Candidatus Eremiobacteraeota bacterium]
MSDILKRIDPDGTLSRDYAFALEACAHRADTYFSTAVALLAERRLLRDPAEPTLATLRTSVLILRDEARDRGDQREVVSCNKVLALLTNQVLPTSHLHQERHGVTKVDGPRAACASPQCRAQLTDAERREVEAQDFTACALFEFRHGSILPDRITDEERDAAHEAARNLLHGLRGVLREPGPTLADVRAPLLHAIAVYATVYANKRQGVVVPGSMSVEEALNRILALLSQPKPEPTYKPGDWVHIGTYGLRIVDTDGAIRLTGGGVRCDDPHLAAMGVRPATPAEIAKARGE